MKQNHLHHVGFSLIELLVVITIVTVLVALAVPALDKARGSARNAVCLSNLKQLGIFTATYAHEWQQYIPAARLPLANNSNWVNQMSDSGYFPRRANDPTSVKSIVFDPRSFLVCPSNSLARFANDQTQYANYAWSRYFGDSVLNPTNWVMYKMSQVNVPSSILNATDGPRDNNNVTLAPHYYLIKPSVLWSAYSYQQINGPELHNRTYSGLFLDGHSASIPESEPRFIDNPNTSAKAQVSYWVRNTANNPPFAF